MRSLHTLRSSRHAVCGLSRPMTKIAALIMVLASLIKREALGPLTTHCEYPGDGQFGSQASSLT